MGLKALVETLDDVQDTFKEFYKEEGGKFVLDIEGIDDHPKVRGVITANRENVKKRDAYKAEADALKTRFNGLPDDFDASTFEQLKAVAEGKGSPTEEQIQQIRDKVREKLEAKYNGEIQTREERLAKLNGALHRMTIDDGLSRAMDEASIDTRHKSKLLPYLKSAGKIAVEEDGDVFKAVVETDLGAVSLAKYVSEWASSDDGKIYVAKSTGPNPNGGKGGSGGNTMKRAEFNALPLAEQAKVATSGTAIVD